ncbi:MAG: MmcQ/YjbR family DNA-binding protein [Betaproteobacteria bacterium]
MNVAAIIKYCAKLPAVTQDVKWGADQVSSVGGKMFCVAYEDEGRAMVSFKVDDDLFLQLTDRAGFVPAPYMARNKWVQVNELKKISDAELKSLLRRSHELVAAKLTKKLRAELGLV